MAKSKRLTRGDWVAVGAMVESTHASEADICTCDPSKFGQGHIERSYSEQAAIARLIATAPALLNFAQMVAATTFVGDNDKVSDIARRAADLKREARDLITRAA